MKFIISNLLVLCFFALSIFALDLPDTSYVDSVSNKCLDCICAAASNCDKKHYYDGNVCGPFRLTYGYWLDAGGPTLRMDNSKSFNEFLICCNDFNCASKAVRNYMNRYKWDCNGDGKVDCDDFVRIHRQGPRFCDEPLEEKYNKAYKNCMLQS